MSKISATKKLVPEPDIIPLQFSISRVKVAKKLLVGNDVVLVKPSEPASPANPNESIKDDLEPEKAEKTAESENQDQNFEYLLKINLEYQIKIIEDLLNPLKLKIENAEAETSKVMSALNILNSTHDSILKKLDCMSDEFKKINTKLSFNHVFTQTDVQNTDPVTEDFKVCENLQNENIQKETETISQLETTETETETLHHPETIQTETETIPQPETTETETETISQPETTQTETETIQRETETLAQTQPEIETIQPETQTTQTDTETPETTQTSAQPHKETDTNESETITQPDSQTIAQPETETITQPETETITQPETETITQPETETNTQPETETNTQPETETTKTETETSQQVKISYKIDLAANNDNIQEEVNESKEKTIDNPEIITKADNFNKFFDATFIMDFTGKGQDYAEQLCKLNIKNCIVISPELPDNCRTKDRVVYYLHMIIDISKEYNYNKINIISDHLLIHNAFFSIFDLMLEQLNNEPWEIVHYCSNTNLNIKQTVDLANFNWNTYITLNPDLNTLSKSTKTHATQDWVSRGIYLGRFSQPTIVSTDSNNVLAFAVKSSSFDLILQQLKDMLTSPTEIPLLKVKEDKKFVILPNLFIIPNTNAPLAKSLKWLPNLYANILANQ